MLVTVKIGMIGFGTVGSGVVKIIREYGAEILQKTGIKLELARVADIDVTSPRVVNLPANLLTTDANEVISDPEIGKVLELIGGIEPARSLILRAIKNGKHVVTANKALLALEGDVIFRAAQASAVNIGFEASVAGTIPIIKTIRESMVANSIESVMGIINGTSNYILSRMTDDGLDFSSALSEAQARGYAEADPAFDLDGSDAKHKLAIILSLAYRRRVDMGDIYCEGITKITSQDIKFATELGYKIKLLAVVRRRGERVEARLHPTLVSANHQIARVDGNYNALHIVGSASNAVFLHGEGAGMMPTASAVMSDVVDIARDISFGVSGRIPLLSPDGRGLERLQIVPMEEIFTKYYIRFMALDRTGVLSKISGIFGDFGISIASVIQKGRMYDGSAVPLVLLTHTSHESSVRNAVSEIRNLEVIADDPMLIRIEEGN